MPSFDQTDIVRLFVFSHPNHELGMFGLLSRPQAHLLVFSDGGGPQRVEQTKRGLERIGMLGRTTLLPHPETRFYEALLARERTFFDDLIAHVRATVERVQPTEIYCDAVELYNPGHDMTLPVVRAALGPNPTQRLFEVPLIHKRADDEGTGYRLQQTPPSLANRRHVVELTQAEVAVKTAARSEVYCDLRAQLGDDVMAARQGQLTREEVMEARELPLEHLPSDVALRYEARGALLKSQGACDEVLTLEGHWLPMVETLIADAGVAAG